MHPVLLKTFGGLTKSYYFRQMFFGLLFAAFFVFTTMQSTVSTHPAQYAFVALCVILYPYSRFVYESIVGFIVGDNIFWANTLVVLFVKLITMTLCFAFAIFIAPIGLIYLYFHHSK